jgi:hypothetical protein
MLPLILDKPLGGKTETGVKKIEEEKSRVSTPNLADKPGHAHEAIRQEVFPCRRAAGGTEVSL